MFISICKQSCPQSSVNRCEWSSIEMLSPKNLIEIMVYLHVNVLLASTYCVVRKEASRDWVPVMYHHLKKKTGDDRKSEEEQKMSRRETDYIYKKVHIPIYQNIEPTAILTIDSRHHCAWAFVRLQRVNTTKKLVGVGETHKMKPAPEFMPIEAPSLMIIGSASEEP